MDLFAINELIMMGVVSFSSTFIFLFNYRQDNRDKYAGHKGLIVFDWFINLGMAVTGYLLISIVFQNVPELQPFASYKYPVGYLFGLTSNVSIPIVLKWFQQQRTKKLSHIGKAK